MILVGKRAILLFVVVLALSVAPVSALVQAQGSNDSTAFELGTIRAQIQDLQDKLDKLITPADPSPASSLAVVQEVYSATLIRIESNVARMEKMYEVFLGATGLIGLLIAVLSYRAVNQMIETRIEKRIGTIHEAVAREMVERAISEKYLKYDNQFAELLADLSRARSRTGGASN